MWKIYIFVKTCETAVGAQHFLHKSLKSKGKIIIAGRNIYTAAPSGEGLNVFVLEPNGRHRPKMNFQTKYINWYGLQVMAITRVHRAPGSGFASPLHLAIRFWILTQGNCRYDDYENSPCSWLCALPLPSTLQLFPEFWHMESVDMAITIMQF